MPARRPRSVNRFHERELARAIRAARKAGESEARVEVDPKTGKISIVLTPPTENKPSKRSQRSPGSNPDMDQTHGAGCP
jgi:hypothetical protein